ncbi:nitrogenase component 1 [Rhizobium lentis]|uniref:nitrogenase component 1 n=1 Tax=Rhizobium lentis TaxID=1138194 RepID=UPI0035C8850C
MEERWNIPFFEGSFYGISSTSESLRRIAQLLVKKGAGFELLHHVEALLAEEEGRAWKNPEVYRRRLEGKRVHLNTGGVKSWSTVHALMEIGMEIVGTSVKKSTARDKERIKQMLKDENHLHQSIAASELYAILREHKPDILRKRCSARTLAANSLR